MMHQLKITTHDTANGHVLAVSGDLDYASAPELRARIGTLRLTAGQRLVVDLAGLHICDSSGITALIVAYQHARAAQAETVLASVPGSLLRTLRIVGLDQLFALYPDTNAAVGG
ncbi:STAS domain-containing protein [Streptomyces sp. NPDC053367]|uniref:STAS domain-containing protein n=1 Tax=Streptomyces sp. NPDC053367 TaxID=3365700 RepID=UPI0037D08703